jgi:sporulation protein YlmC with PRC-barrel domain
MGDVLGMEVVELNGSVIGVVKNVMFDEKIWEVTSLDVELNKKTADELDAKKLFRHFRIPLSVSYIQGIGDKVLLKGSAEEVMTALSAQDIPS